MHIQWPFHSHRTEILSRPFPEEWLHLLNKRIKHFEFLTPDEKSRLKDDLRIVMEEKNWEGALDFEITDEVKVTIGALASLLTIGFPHHDYFPNVNTIIVYPTSYIAPAGSIDGRTIDEVPEARLGEAHGNGPIILSWSDIASDSNSSTNGHSLVQHEFAHKLDFRDGYADGVPQLRDTTEFDDWAKVMSAEYELLVEQVKHKSHTLIRPYGATDPAEFFAVCTECYFEKPVKLKSEKPALYRVLRDYYGIDWAARLETTPRHPDAP